MSHKTPSGAPNGPAKPPKQAGDTSMAGGISKRLEGLSSLPPPLRAFLRNRSVTEIADALQLGKGTASRIKRHLERETLRTGKKLTQRDFVLNLITQALDEAEAESAAEQDFPAEAPAEARVDDEATPADTDTPDEESAV